MTHDDLCALGVRWLKNTGRCKFVVREPTINVSGVSETPDAWGFNSYGQSILLEAKASRGDFLADKRKWFRRIPGYGLGQFRYYIAPAGIIAADDLPPRWGLIVANGERCRRTVKASAQLVWGENYERRFIMAMLSRLELRGPRLRPDGRLPEWVSDKEMKERAAGISVEGEAFNPSDQRAGASPAPSESRC